MTKLMNGFAVGLLAFISSMLPARAGSQSPRVWVEPESVGHVVGPHTIHLSGVSPSPCWEYGDPIVRFEEGVIRIEVPAHAPDPDVICTQVITGWTKSVSVPLDYEQLGEGDVLQNGYRGFEIVASYALEDGSVREIGTAYLAVPAFAVGISRLDAASFLCKNLRTGRSVKLQSPPSVLEIGRECLSKGPKVKPGDKVQFTVNSVVR